MRMQKIGHAIGISLIGLTFLLTAPDTGTSQQTVRSGLSADRPLNYHLSALSSNSFFSRHGGIWVRHEGMWAFRPTLHFDWQAYFRCQAGHGCGGLGWAPHRFGSWLPFGFGGWDLVPGGWMWFPGQRLARSPWDLFWDLYFFYPSHRFGSYGRVPQLRFAPIRWDGGRALNQRPGQDSDGWKPPTEASARDQPRPLVDPVNAGPIVTVSADLEDSEPSGRKAPQKPSIDPVPPARTVETLFEPTSIQKARQKSLRRPGTDPLGPTRETRRLRSIPDLSRLAPEGLRLESPRAFEQKNPWVYRNRITTGIDRMPSARSWPGTIRPRSESSRPAQPQSNGGSKSTGKSRTAPKQ